MFRSSEISLIVNRLFGRIISLTLPTFSWVLMLKDVPMSPPLQPIHNHYGIALTTRKPSSWSLQRHHKLILTFHVFLQHFLNFMLIRCSWFMVYGTLQNTPSLDRSSQPTKWTEQVETCHTLLLRFDAPLLVLKIPAFPLDRTRQQHSP